MSKFEVEFLLSFERRRPSRTSAVQFHKMGQGTGRVESLTQAVEKPQETIRHEGLVPCFHRKVDENGRILCGLIKGGDREVSVNLCRSCAVPQINCQHLRASVQKIVPTPITVRYATGRVEVWDNELPTVGFKQAACSVKVMPIHSARDCAGCPIRTPVFQPQTAFQAARRARSGAALDSPHPPVDAITRDESERLPARTVAPANVNLTEMKSAESTGIVERAQELAANKQEIRARGKPAGVDGKPKQHFPKDSPSKIILFQKWLAEQVGKRNLDDKAASPAVDEAGVQEIIYAQIAPSYLEEPGQERCVGWTD